MKTNLTQLMIIAILCCIFGLNSFSQPFTLQTGIFPTQDFGDIDLGDYDNDGDLDYLIFYHTGEYPNIKYYIKVFENEGGGSFKEAVSILSVYGGNSISWFDFDKDNDLDILHVSGSYGSNGVEIYKNNGNKTFSKISDNFVDEYDGNNVIGDLNNDGYPDIIYNGHMTNKTYIYLNNGNSTFSVVTNHPIIGLCYGSIALADFDGNGYQDILISGNDFLGMKNYTKVYKNNGNSTFSEIPSTFTGVSNTSGVRGTPSRWGDYNNDGKLDVIQVGNGYIYLYKNNGDGSFSSQDSISVPNIASGSISLDDYDKDGDLDILVSGYRSFSTYTYRASKVFRNNGNGNFTEDLSISLSDQVNGITHWVDYDNDGDLDVVLNGLLYRNDRIVSSVKDPEAIKTIKLYPNPTNEFLYFQGEQKKYEITIRDITGKVYNVINSRGGQIKISVVHLSKGIYVIHINDGKNEQMEKFIKN